jgi:GTP-binding protein EngB required for normal cell division
MSREAESSDRLQSRLSRLVELLSEDGDRLPPELADRAETTANNAQSRLGHGTTHTVVALAGATGSGKSSLFNAIAGQTLAETGVRRPTTSVARAAIFGPDASSLLDWLQIPQRDQLDDESLSGLVLVDLPDHDSTAAAHRAEAERLVRVVDVMCWVVDPQKYADAALHEDFIQRYSGHGAVTLVLLNQSDRLHADDLRKCLAHLGDLLQGDGLQGVRTMAVSATTNAGIVDVRRELQARVAERRALVSRLDADLDWLVGDLAVSCGEANPVDVSTGARERLVRAAATVAGVDTVADAVAGTYRHRATLAVGWPPTRWVKRLRAEPLRRIGLGKGTPEFGSGNGKDSGNDSGSDSSVTISRSSIPAPTTLAIGGLATAGRDLVADVSGQLPEHWERRVRTVVDPTLVALPDLLDRGIGSQAMPLERPRWWTVLGTIQRLLALAMVAGMVWLGVLFVLKWFQIPDPPMLRVGSVPLPTVLALGGGLLGFVIAVIGRQLVMVGSSRRREIARKELSQGIAEIVDAQVVAPVNTEMAAQRRVLERVRKLDR